MKDSRIRRKILATALILAVAAAGAYGLRKALRPNTGEKVGLPGGHGRGQRKDRCL